MPAHHQAFVTFLIALCRVRGIPTVFTITKRKTHARGFRQVTAIVTQTRAAFEHMRALLPDHNVHLIVPGSAESLEPDQRDRGKSVLFVGVPWNSRDLERRGVFLFFDVVRATLKRDPGVRFTLLNRALSQSKLIDRCAAELPKENLEVHHGSSNRMSDWYAKHAAFLVLHKDDACPDPPLSAIEACCCGCAIITTRFNGLAQDLSEARAGVEVEPTASSVTDGILKVLSAPAAFQANAFALGRERFGKDAFCGAYARIYAAMQGG
jgi:glycosyltransferase involved in cell wall biosynthesis